MSLLISQQQEEQVHIVRCKFQYFFFFVFVVKQLQLCVVGWLVHTFLPKKSHPSIQQLKIRATKCVMPILFLRFTNCTMYTKQKKYNDSSLLAVKQLGMYSFCMNYEKETLSTMFILIIFMFNRHTSFLCSFFFDTFFFLFHL